MMTIDRYQDIIDVRDIIERVEELEPSDQAKELDADEYNEYRSLWALLDELAGNGGDEQWRGDWYPITLIRDSYFTAYAQELAEDIGAISSDATWPSYCIDWAWAARELQMDYSTVEYDGVTYWYR